jgi:hypothetical protein
VNQGPRGDCLMKKTEGQKSRDTVPLKADSADRIVCWSWMRCHLLHGVSFTPHAFLIFLHTIAVLYMIFTFWREQLLPLLTHRKFMGFQQHRPDILFHDLNWFWGEKHPSPSILYSLFVYSPYRTLVQLDLVLPSICGILAQNFLTVCDSSWLYFAVRRN